MAREYPEYPVPAVSGVIFDRNDRVLLIKRGKPPAEGMWSFPGGVLRLGEELEEGLCREIHEECGLEVDVGPLLSVSSRIVYDGKGKIQYHYVLLDYYCQYRFGVPSAHSDAIEINWFAPDSIPLPFTTIGLLDIVKKGIMQRRA